MTGPVDATVLVAGQVIASTRADYQAGEPTVLDGLNVEWGRATSIDQPDPSAATLTIAQRGNGPSALLGTLRTGAPVEIRASGIIFPGPTVSTFLDPGFESAPVGSRPPGDYRNAAAAVSTIVPQAGAHTLTVDPIDPAHPTEVILAPAPFSANPTAWDLIPATSLGQPRCCCPARTGAP